MSPLKSLIARKAARATARHGVHGTASKLRREPFRSATLLAAGALVGACAGWAVGHGSASPPAG